MIRKCLRDTVNVLRNALYDVFTTCTARASLPRSWSIVQLESTSAKVREGEGRIVLGADGLQLGKVGSRERGVRILVISGIIVVDYINGDASLSVN